MRGCLEVEDDLISRELYSYFAHKEFSVVVKQKY